MATTSDFLLEQYRRLVSRTHPARVSGWPILSGYNLNQGKIGDYGIYAFVHTGTSSMTNVSGVGEIDAAISGVTVLDPNNREPVRERLIRHFRLKVDDALIILHQPPDGRGGVTVKLPDGELERILLQHETALGLTPMKIFLSHKGADKSVVRDFDKTLKAIGFEPWLDEDAMVAGDTLERALLKGFNDSCAVIFFVTENFLDENYLETEINYALAQKRAKKDKFAIITLCFNRGGKRGLVPEILKTSYLYKEPATDLEALREIIRALPIRVGDVRWRS